MPMTKRLWQCSDDIAFVTTVALQTTCTPDWVINRLSSRRWLAAALGTTRQMELPVELENIQAGRDVGRSALAHSCKCERP